MSKELEAWLTKLSLGQYAPVFHTNAIDMDVVMDLTDADLIGLGVAALGHRKRLLNAIAALRQSRAGLDPIHPSDPLDAKAERRQLTVLFCDLADSTALSARLDPEDMREVIRAYQKACAGVIARHDGFVAKFMGDGLLAYFGYPRAHEDEAERAVRAGLDILSAVSGLQTPARQALQVRIGIATGLVVVGDLIGAGAAEEQSVVGETPNLAARLQVLAKPNTIVISEGARRQVGGLFELCDLGVQTLKGFATRQRAWQVLGESDLASRFEALRSRATALVGREEELEVLMRRWTSAKAGEGRVVLLCAEPGVGKSRLTEALQELILTERHRSLRYFCSPHHSESALHPIIKQLERAAGFERGDDVTVKCRKLVELLAEGTAEEELPLFAELLSVPDVESKAFPELTPQRKKEKTFDVLLRMLERLARQQPLLMVFEDLHWMDPTSLEFLDRTIARVDQLPVLLIATFRPEFHPPWSGQAYVSTLTLSRLGRSEATTLVRRLAGNTTLSNEIVAEIVERTDGVPLFVEEVTKVVLEATNGMDTTSAGATIATIPSTRPVVPATLQASLLARLDRLGPAAREVAQAGGAIGREFPYDLLVSAAPRAEAETRNALDQLVGAGLVFQHGVPPAATYHFKHALVQDTAYGTLLRGPRQALHGRIAEAIEKRTPERGEREAEVLAHHFAEAGQPERAAAYWLAAGRRDAGRSSNVEAIAHLGRGIQVLAAVAETPEHLRLELALQLALGPALMTSKGFGGPGVVAAYLRGRELAGRLGDDRALFAAVWGAWLSTGQSQGGYRVALVDELSRVAERMGDPELRLQAHHAAWPTFFFGGDLTHSLDHIRKGLKLYDREKHGTHALLYGGHDPAVCGLGNHAEALWILGYPDQAVGKVSQSMVLANDLAHMPTVGYALFVTGRVHMMRRDAPTALDIGGRLVALSREHGLAQYEAVGGIVRGWARAQLGEPEEGLAELSAAVSAYRSSAQAVLSFFLVALAETELRGGYIDRADATLAEAQAVATDRRELLWMSQIMRVKGDLQATRTPANVPAAKQFYDQSLVFARERKAMSLELQASLGLAKLLLKQGQQKEARDLLAPICSWFTEGFDTPDLKEAKALLDG